MKLSTKSLLGLSIIAITITVLVSVAFYGINRLSASLDYIIGPAWSTADGAMESTIMLQQQIHLTNQMLLGAKISDQQMSQALTDGNEAMSRLIAAQLISANEINGLQTQTQSYQASQKRLIAEYRQFSQLKTEFDQVTERLVALLEELEERGDSAVEELEQSPDRLISWNSGLKTKWQAADGGMETTIGLLQQQYYLERILKGDNFDLFVKRHEAAKAFMASAMEEMLATKSFDVPSQLQAGQTQAAALTAYVASFFKLQSQVIANFKQYHDSLLEYEEQTEALLAHLAVVEEQGDETVEGQTASISATKNSIYVLMLISFIAGLVVVFFLLFMTRREILSPLQMISARVRDVSEGDGDLSKRINLTRSDEVGDLSRYFDQFISKLHSLISNVSSHGHNLTQAVDNSISHSELILQSAINTSANSNDLAAVSQKMLSISQATSQSCSEAAEHVESANQEVSNGQQKVVQTVQSMNTIATKVTASSNAISSLKAQADSIGQMVSVIASISEQTNLLALNAAIEAARAGEQGRGFAVVADEVRTLAQRTADSTKEISDVIKGIQDSTNESFNQMQLCVDEVNGGVDLSTQAGESLNKILSQISHVSELINQVTTATEQQTTTIGDVSTKVNDIAELANQSKLDAQSNMASIEQLSQSSSQLAAELGLFKL